MPTPPLFTAPPRRDTRLFVPVSEAERQLVHELARREGVSASAFVRQAVADRLAAQADREALAA